MKTAWLAFTAMLLFHFLPLAVRCVSNEDNFVLTGHINIRGSNSAERRFNVKLYPPKSSKRPVILTSADNSGNFAFKGLAASSYLLEVYLGADLVNQQVVLVDGNKEIWIQLR